MKVVLQEYGESEGLMEKDVKWEWVGGVNKSQAREFKWVFGM
jgi:hypothetical protein